MALKFRSVDYTGDYKLFGNAPTHQVITRRVDEQVINVSDSPRLNHAFRADHMSRRGATLSGSLGYVDYWQGALSEAYSWSKDLPPAQGSLLSTNDIWALTNPGRSDVSAPVFTWEAREVPEMLFQAGRILLAIKRRQAWRNLVRWNSPKEVAAANLAYQFGWAPLIGDLHKLAMLGDATTKRANELKRLFSPKGLTRRIGPRTSTKRGSAQQWPMWTVGGATVYTTITPTTTIEEWAVVSWLPVAGQAAIKNPMKPMPMEVKRLLLGITSHHLAEAAWEALPWSWLIDWMIPIGTAIKAGNRAVAKPNGGTRMTRSIITWNTQEQPLKPVTWKLSSGVFSTTSHQRQLLTGPTLPTASIPLLGPRQLSVLGSLAIMRAR